MKRQNLGKINSSNYQSLYLWTSFLLGFIIWQRRQTFSVIPAKSNIISNNSIVIPANAGIQLSPSKFLDSHLYGDDKFLTSIIFTPLILSALAFQQSGSVTSGLLFGLGSYVSKTTAQSALALTIEVTNLGSNEGILFTGVASAGSSNYAADLNGDNKTDLLIGAYLSNKMYLAFWPFITTNLETLNGSAGVIFTGKTGTGFTAYTADMNRDNNTDILFGTYDIAQSGNPETVYLAYGPGFSVTNLESLSGSQGVVFRGELGTGYSVYAADINRDGNLDLLTGAYDVNKAYLAFGPINNTNLASLSGSEGVVFTGSAYTGSAIYAADMNRDGNLDILIGANLANKVYLVYGPTFSVTNLDNLSGSQGVIFTGASYTGSAIYVADMNRDGNLDILIGAQGTNTMYLAYGPKFNVTNLDDLNNSQGVVFKRNTGTVGAVFAADMNGDGHLDLVIGASGFKTYLVYGPNFANATNLDALTLTQGVIFTGGVFAQTSNIADMNGDGALDIILTGENGSVYVVYNHVFNIFPPLITTVTTTLPTTLTSIATMQQQTETALTITSKEATSRNIVLPASTVSIEPILTTKLSPAENSNAMGSMIGIGVGACVIGTLFGAVGFFAVNKYRKKKEKANNHSNAMRDVSENNQNIDLGNNSARTANSNQYQTAPVFDSRYNSARLQHQDQHSTAATPTNTQNNYRDIDETKKIEEQYENVPKLEI